MEAFQELSYNLQETILGFDEKRKKRLIKKIEEIGEGVKELIPSIDNYSKIKKQSEEIKTSDNDKNILKSLISQNCFLEGIKVGFYGYKKSSNIATLEYMYSSNNKTSSFLNKDYEEKMLKEDITKEYYMYQTIDFNKKFFEQEHFVLEKQEYIGSSIFLKFIEEIKNTNIEEILIKSLVSSIGFYKKILNILKEKNIISEYNIIESNNPLEKDIEVYLSKNREEDEEGKTDFIISREDYNSSNFDNNISKEMIEKIKKLNLTARENFLHFYIGTDGNLYCEQEENKDDF